jgi:hypothetical protein
MPEAEQDFFSERKRRGVFRVAAMLAVVGWLVVKIANASFDVRGVPKPLIAS